MESVAAGPSAPRSGSKLARVIELLQRDHGATIDELIDATDWLAHTTRAALTGLRKRGYAVVSDRSERGSFYRIVADLTVGDRASVARPVEDRANSAGWTKRRCSSCVSRRATRSNPRTASFRGADSNNAGRSQADSGGAARQRMERQSGTSDGPGTWLRLERRNLRQPVAGLIDALRDAQRWLDELTTKSDQTIEVLAAREGRTERSIRMTLSLAFLCPALARAAIDGRLPRGFGIKRLMASNGLV